MIRRATSADAAAIAAIYNHYVANTVVTFEEEAVPVEEMAKRLREIESAGLPWLVASDHERVVGYAYAGRWKARRSYRFSVETTIYLAHDATGCGHGTALYSALLVELKSLGVHAVIGGVALPNPASVALHGKLGFKPVAQFREVGWKFQRWIDVGYWELILSDHPPSP
jgi:L-amino acid N-acyltransferase YncA